MVIMGIFGDKKVDLIVTSNNKVFSYIITRGKPSEGSRINPELVGGLSRGVSNVGRELGSREHASGTLVYGENVVAYLISDGLVINLIASAEKDLVKEALEELIKEKLITPLVKACKDNNQDLIDEALKPIKEVLDKKGLL